MVQVLLTCHYCKAIFTRYPSQLKRPGRGKYCSKACMPNYRGKRSNVCLICTKALSLKRGVKRPQYCRDHFSLSPEFMSSVRATQFQRGHEPHNKGKVHRPNETNPSWKGDEVGYSALHQWVTRHLGRPSHCEMCKTDDQSKRYEWANKSRLYRRDLADWMRLCKKCHNDYDGVNAWQNKSRVKGAV